MKTTLKVAAFLSIILVSFVLVGCGGSDDGYTPEKPPTHTIQLHEPSGFAINWDTLVATWEQVENANSYEIRVRPLSTIANMPIVTVSEATANLSSLNLTYGAFNVYIRAIGQQIDDTLYRDSDFTAGMLFAVRQATQIPILPDLRLDGTHLRWDALPYVGPIQSYTITATLPDGSQRNFFRTLTGFSGILPTEFYLTELHAGVTQVSISATVLSPDGVITLTSPQTPITLFPDVIPTGIRFEINIDFGWSLVWNDVIGATSFQVDIINTTTGQAIRHEVYQGISLFEITRLSLQFIQGGELDLILIANSTTADWTTARSEPIPLMRYGFIPPPDAFL